MSVRELALPVSEHDLALVLAARAVLGKGAQDCRMSDADSPTDEL
jgi:hypothetical protein